MAGPAQQPRRVGGSFNLHENWLSKRLLRSEKLNTQEVVLKKKVDSSFVTFQPKWGSQRLVTAGLPILATASEETIAVRGTLKILLFVICISREVEMVIVF